MRLTGWQRLWVLFSVLSLVVFMAVAILMLPKPFVDPDIVDLIDSPEKCAGIPEKRGQIFDPFIDGLELELDCLKVEKIKKTNPDIRTGDDYRVHVQTEHKTNRLYLIGGVTLFWLNLIVFVYLAGWAVAWVARGFKGS